MHKLTREEFIRRVTEVRDDVCFQLTTFLGLHHDVLVRCKNCGDTSIKRADTLIRGQKLNCSCSNWDMRGKYKYESDLRPRKTYQAT